MCLGFVSIQINPSLAGLEITGVGYLKKPKTQKTLLREKLLFAMRSSAS